MATLSLCAVSAAWASEPATLLILPFENATGQAQYNTVSKGLPDILTAFLAPESDHVRIVEREKLEQIMAEQSMTWENVMAEKSAGRLGQLAQARYILRGSVTGTEKNLKVQALLYETESMRLVKTFESVKASSVNQHAETLAAAISKFFSADLKPIPQLPVDSDPEKNLHLIQGLGYYHQGQYTKAIPEFMKILQKSARDPDAKYWLGKSFYGAGLKGDAAVEFRQFLEWFPNDSRRSEVKTLLTPRS